MKEPFPPSGFSDEELRSAGLWPQHPQLTPQTFSGSIMTADQRLLAMSFVVSATAFLLGCVAAGIAWGSRVTVGLSLLALASNCMSYVAQLAGFRNAAILPSVTAWVCGIAALALILAQR